MAKSRKEVIAEAPLHYADGHTAEAIDELMGHPEPEVFDRYINDLAEAIDQAITDGAGE